MDISLDEIKADLKRGRMRLANIHWLVEQVEQQREQIQELKNKTRFKCYLDMAQENLALEEGLKRVQEQRDHYKKAYEACIKAI